MKLSLLKTLSLGVAAGAISLCSPVQAQMAPTDSMPMTPPATGTMPMSSSSASTMMPMPVSGTVLRYYVNRAGYVTAMDVQAADGVKLVRFSPAMAQNLTSMYPVGSTASVNVTSTMMGSMTRYDLASMGSEMPAPGAMMMPMMVSDIDLLKAEPYTTLGAQPMRVTGNISSFIADPMNGEVLALVLDGKTLLRVPRENRLVQASKAPEGVVPLVKGADVVAYGLPEAPRYGAVSPYETRLIATGIAVNGRTLGALGFGSVKTSKKNTLFGFNIPLPGSGSMSSDESSAMGQGYATYSAPGTPSGSMGTMDSGTSGNMGSGTTGDMGTGSTGTGSTGTSSTGTNSSMAPAPGM